jgi:hypothetical protein
MMILGPIAAMVIQMAISRTREFAADATAAEYCGTPDGLISGLKKLESWSQRIPMDASPGHGSHVHHQAVQRLGVDEVVLDAPADRRAGRCPAGSTWTAGRRLMPTVRINRKATDRVASGHPWIFASDVIDRGDAQPGEAVHVADFRNRVVGTAHYSAASQITLRLLSNRQEQIDRDFLRRRLGAAIALRDRVVQDSNAYRVVYTEGDLLPALIVDRYADYLSIQTLNQGMDRLQPEVVACLEELLAPKGIIARNDVAVRTRENLPVETRIVSGEVPARVEVSMNGLHWHADLVQGQKTGVYLDQRETTWRPPGTAAETPSIASPRPAALPSISPEPASASRASTAPNTRFARPKQTGI